MLGSGVDDMLPMAQGTCKICLLTGLDQVVAYAGGPCVCDLFHQCVARPVMGLGEQQGTALDGNAYKAMSGVRRTIPSLAVEDSNCRMCRADSRPSVKTSVAWWYFRLETYPSRACSCPIYNNQWCCPARKICRVSPFRLRKVCTDSPTF
jgi:hypothetical protein